MFSSKNSIVSGLMFRSLVLLSLYLCMVLESVLISLFYMELTTGLLAKETVALHSSQLSLSLHFCFKRHRTSKLRCHLHITSTSPPARLHLPHTPSSLPITTRRWTEALRPSHHTRSQTTLSPPLQHPTLKGHALIYFPASLLSRPL